MIMKTSTSAFLPLFLTLLLLSPYAWAGQPCGELPLEPAETARATQLGDKVRDALERSGAELAFVARVGIDMSEFGLHYSHVGVAWRDHPNGRWMTFHLLNACGTPRSELLEQPLENFYKVKLFDYDALIAIPSLDVQARLVRAFFSPIGRQLHQPLYNLIAHPFSTRFQNSNQWLLEVTAAALAPAASIMNREQAQAWLKANGYEPSRVRIGTTRRWGSALFTSHVHFSDHTDEEARSQLYAVVTSDSIIRFFARIDPGMVTTELSLKAEPAK